MTPLSSVFVGWAVTMPVNILVAAVMIAAILALFTLLEVKLAQSFGFKEAVINGATDVGIVLCAVLATWIAVGYP